VEGWGGCGEAARWREGMGGKTQTSGEACATTTKRTVRSTALKAPPIVSFDLRGPPANLDFQELDFSRKT